MYAERLSSKKTEGLFIGLMTLFLLLAVWRISTAGLDALASLFLCFFILFLFYSLNYRTLIITLSQRSLRLQFGVFSWTEHLDNIDACALDEIPKLKRFGGAGIHFMFIHKRYRASFNFLEYPRVVMTLKKKRGLVQDVSFSTTQPKKILGLLGEAIGGKPSHGAK